MSLFNITLIFWFSSPASKPHIQDNALRVFSALQDKPTDFEASDYTHTLKLTFSNREFPNRFEALSWAKNVEKISLNALKGERLARDRADVIISDSSG